MSPDKIDKIAIAVLLILDAAAIIIGMVAGMTRHTTISQAASGSAIVISLGVIFYMNHLRKIKNKK